MLPHRLQAIWTVPDRFPIDGVPFDIASYLPHQLFHGWRNIYHIVAADNERPNAPDLFALNLFCLVQHKVHVDVIPLQYTPKFPAALEGDDYWLPVQHLIQNIQRPLCHVKSQCSITLE
jgi:hypothetical protein